MFCSDGLLLSVSVFPNPKARLRLLVSHGNGLASAGYRVFWEPLLEHFEVVMLDMRGHGNSEPGDAQLHNIDQFIVDLQSVLGALRGTDPRPLVGAFHSLSAIVSLLHLHRFPAANPWHSLVLFDPPLSGPIGHPLTMRHRDEMMLLSTVTGRRRRVYASIEDRARHFLRTEVFGHWVDGAAMDMAQATLRPANGGTAWKLSCDPEREAFVYRSATSPLAWNLLTTAPRPCPIKLISADPFRDNAESPARMSLLAAETSNVAYERVADTGHFLQLEQPERCRAALLSFVRP